MKLKTYFNATLLCLAVDMFAACTGNELTDASKDKQAKEEVKGVHFTINDPRLSTKTRRVVLGGRDGNSAIGETRTIIKHTPGQGAEAYWSEGDQIWVEDKNGNWQRSISTVLREGGASADFTLPGTQSDYRDGCIVRYVGQDAFTPPISGGNPQIDPNQPQITPNDFSKAGEYGDCGTGNAHATGNSQKWNFTLEHAVSYLCLLPRCENAALGQNIVLTNIAVEAADKTAGPDWISVDGYCANMSDGVLNLNYYSSSPSSYNYAVNSISGTVNNFPLTNVTTNAATNACYLMLMPETHNLTVTYTIKDKVTNVETEIKKPLGNVVCNAGEINDITANLSLRNQPMYYTWDSENNVGDIQYDSSSPTTLSATTATVYAFGFGDANVPGTTAHVDNTVSPTNPKRIDATHTYMNGVPNVNEMMWYAYKGDARWVNQGPVIAVSGNLVRTAGVWLKKKTKILADEHITEAYMRDGFALGGGAYTDYRINPINGTAPKVSVGTSLPANLDDYFFVPALGYYVHYGNNWYDFYNPEGYYWTSSATPTSPSVAYGLYFSQTGISIKENYVYNPYCVLPFE